MRKKQFILAFIFMFFFFFTLSSYEAKADTTNGDNISVKYSTHVQNIGWQNSVYDGQLAGTSGQSLRLEGITISLDNPISGMRIKYQTQIQNIGWQNWVYDGQVSGTLGKGLRLEAIKIILEGAPSGYHIQYQVHVQNVGWQNWVQDGAMAGTQGQSLRLEGIRIRIVKAESSLTGALGVGYKTHVQNVGWQDSVYDGALSGTQGLAYRLEGINISLQNPLPGMRIKYQTQIQNIGWQNWVYDGALSGTQGKGLRLEAIRIALENAPPWIQIKYQVHVQNIGWQEWVQDGAVAGTVGQGLRLEAIRILLVDTKNFTYVTYNMTLDNMVSAQMNTGAVAYDTLNSNNQWEWRYAEIQNGQQGYYVYVPRVDSQGAVVVDSSGNTVYDKKWTNSPTEYQNIQQQLKNYLDPNLIIKDTKAVYEFLKLSYVDGTTAEQLNSILGGVLAGKGQVYIDAAKQNNINPIYLASHSILETGNGTSNLAKGINVNGTVVYNLFGIQAYDSNPDMYGSQFAASKGWTSIDKAIYGGAQYISSSYINNPVYKQDTLYKMRWNPSNPTVHQYATDLKWAYNQTNYIKQCFDMFRNAKLIFEIPVYKQ